MINSLTIIAVAVYILIIGIVTYLSSKKESNSDFLVASRNLRWKEIGLSTFATMISSYNLVIGITFAFLFGFHFIIIMLGAFLGLFGVYIIAKRNYKNFTEKKFHECN